MLVSCRLHGTAYIVFSVLPQGRFDIISLTGSYVRSDLGGKAGGLSACLLNTNGQIVGGGVGGPLIAAGPVEVP